MSKREDYQFIDIGAQIFKCFLLGTVWVIVGAFILALFIDNIDSIFDMISKIRYIFPHHFSIDFLGVSKEPN